MSKELKVQLSTTNISVDPSGRVVIDDPKILDMISKELDIDAIRKTLAADDNTGCGNNVYKCTTSGKDSFEDFTTQMAEVKAAKIRGK